MTNLSKKGYLNKYLFAVVISLICLCVGFVLCYVYLVIPLHQATSPTLPPQQVSNHKHNGAQMIAVITQMRNFMTALDAFKVDTGSYPGGTNTLQVLVHRPFGTTNWIGPYVSQIPKDPWDQDYVYECPGRHTSWGYHYDLFSLGPPGETNPIANWSTPGMQR
jgi:general secretion pathway protein G